MFGIHPQVKLFRPLGVDDVCKSLFKKYFRHCDISPDMSKPESVDINLFILLNVCMKCHLSLHMIIKLFIWDQNQNMTWLKRTCIIKSHLSFNNYHNNLTRYGLVPAHFRMVIGHVSHQCHACKQEIDLNGFPRHLWGHVLVSACVGICLSIKLLLAALPIPPSTPLIWAFQPTAQRPGHGLNERLSSAKRQGCFHSYSEQYIVNHHSLVITGLLWKLWMYS